ncbi:S-adenosyl-L-methionine dependent methyltransferase [Daedaleopsis nitida]|nr:S-adenosyl-L-methionine dependent methyltransferase [Daedaleopsis nitida]
MAASASIYTNLMLRFYDFIVLSFSNSFAWRCPTRSTLLPFYARHLGESAHLEIGVGTGYYPAASAAAGALAKTKRVTLLDLNPNTLVYAQRRLAAAGYTGAVDVLEHDVFKPLGESMRASYDSVALVYVFHCLPGAFPDKARAVFTNVVPTLAPGGVVYGATILGDSDDAGVSHNWLGRRLVRTYNEKGMFGNKADTEKGLRAALDEVFEEWKVRVVGVVALFEARQPRTGST